MHGLPNCNSPLTPRSNLPRAFSLSRIGFRAKLKPEPRKAEGGPPMKPASARHITLLAATLIISATAMTAPASAQAFDQRHRQFASAQGEVPLVRITHVVEENDLPAIDLEVFFNFDSAEITPRLCQS